MMMCDVDNELEERGFDVPTFTRRKTKVQILRGYLDDEERRERLAIAEAKRYKKWILAVREKKKVLQNIAIAHSVLQHHRGTIGCTEEIICISCHLRCIPST